MYAVYINMPNVNMAFIDKLKTIVDLSVSVCLDFVLSLQSESTGTVK